MQGTGTDVPLVSATHGSPHLHLNDWAMHDLLAACAAISLKAQDIVPNIRPTQPQALYPEHLPLWRYYVPLKLSILLYCFHRTHGLLFIVLVISLSSRPAPLEYVVNRKCLPMHNQHGVRMSNEYNAYSVPPSPIYCEQSIPQHSRQANVPHPLPPPIRIDHHGMCLPAAHSLTYPLALSEFGSPLQWPLPLRAPHPLVRVQWPR
jgi:hypothetical protein